MTWLRTIFDYNVTLINEVDKADYFNLYLGTIK